MNTNNTIAPMNWIEINSTEQLADIKQKQGYSVIFKHSTRCTISIMAKKRFEMDWEAIPPSTPLYYLDLLNHRDISALIAEDFSVHHESPQLLLIKDGECIFDASHGDIDADEAATQMN